MRDNAVKYNKQRAQTPLGDAPLVHVAGTGGVALWFIIKTQLLRLSDGVCWVGWRTSTAPRRVYITLDVIHPSKPGMTVFGMWKTWKILKL